MRYAVLVVVVVVAILGGAFYVLSQSGLEEEILCPVDNSPYVGTFIGTSSENFNWICYENGYTWTNSYPKAVYQAWLKAFLPAEYVRDYTLLYLRQIKGIEMLPDPLTLNWTGGRETPEGLVGVETYIYQADGLVVTVRYPVVLPENTRYEITVESQGATVWEGELLQREFTTILPVSEEESLEIARNFILDSPTYRFDGIEGTLELVETLHPDTPYSWEFVFRFESRHAGYGDRTGQVLAQVITPHTVHVIVQEREVTSALMDEKWDMIKQGMLP